MDLLARLRDGDRDALRELMASYWEPLVVYVVRMLECPDSAEDVVQETFVRLWTNRSSFTHDGSAGALVHQIARNLALKRVRHRGVRKKKKPELRQFFRRVVRTPLEETVMNETRDRLSDAIDDLPPRRREAFVLLRYQGLSLQEAAQIMGLTKQTVANHAVMAMNQLRSLLQEYEQQ